MSAKPNATDEILAWQRENYSLRDRPLPAGSQYVLVRLRVTRLKEGSGEFFDAGLSLVGASNVAYDLDAYEYGIPDLFPDVEVFKGGTVEGNVAWIVRSTDAGSLVLYEPQATKRVYFSLVPR